MTLAKHAAVTWDRVRPSDLARPRIMSALRELRLAWILAGILFGWLAIFAWMQPLSPDEAVYKIVATGALHGQWPYRDLFDHKPPLAYAWYLPAALGAGMMTERVLAALCCAGSVPVFAVVARRWLRGRQPAFATVAFAALLANPGLAVRANLESFLLLPLVGAFAVTTPLLAGVLLGIAVMTKPMALLFAPVLLLVWKRQAWKAAAGAAAIGGAASLPFVPIWHDYWTANVTFNLEYGSMPLAERLRTLFTVPAPIFVGWLPLWGLLAAAALRMRAVRVWLLALCGVASVKLSGQDFNHYYTLVAPGAAMLAAPGLAWAWPRLAFRGILIVAVLASLLPVFLGFPSLVRNYDAIHHPLGAAASVIDATPGEFFVLGDHEQPYVQADRQPERRFFFVVPAIVRPEWGEEMRQGLLACPPAILVTAGDSLFTVPWKDQVTALYARRIDVPAGQVYLNPRITCTR